MIKAVNQGFKLHTAYPSMYMDSVMYFLGRLGIPRLSLRVVDADPRAMPFKAVTDADVVRNIAYLHVVKEIASGVNCTWARGGPHTQYTGY
ncbi:hypothetical protein [Vulcanisaeta distributa]|uniref:hypothetical protein n=1 Tax=Vulcanisaeta distributa TaxID=164451 RepID=UPI0006CFEBE2|nr:hypothetical protein [Vulcanisaeta distributa]